MSKLALLDPTKTGRPAEDLEKRLRHFVVGQEEAIHQVVRAYQTHVAGLSPVGRPIGKFLFLGPTGSKKTRIVEATAESLLKNSRAVIKIDCAEFQHSHEIAKLIGSPPGYLAHRETHALLSQEALNQHHTDTTKLSFVLFDEIEKASDALWNLLLGILDKATLTLGDNRRVDFSAAMVFLTSNLGAAEMSSLVTPRLGFHVPSFDDPSCNGTLSTRISRTGVEAARRKFTPEFINRLDKIVVFKSLGTEELRRIVDIELEMVQQRIQTAAASRPFLVNVTDSAKEFLLIEGTDLRYGARHLKRATERLLVQPLSNLMASGQIRRSDCIPREPPGTVNCSPVCPRTRRGASVGSSKPRGIEGFEKRTTSIEMADERKEQRMAGQTCWATEVPTGNHNASFEAEDSVSAEVALESSDPCAGGLPRIVGNSTALRSVLDMVRIVAPTDATVLVEGETGTGKELIAEAIHRCSDRSKGPFVKVNCAAIPAGLLESELFGHERGAYTGAFARIIGRFERANLGTLFLDEIGDLPLELQPKLLRVIQERQFERLGGATTIHTDVRVICATHRNLVEMVDECEFRADLFYRLSVFPIELPPLRERPDHVLLLAKYFIDRHATKAGKNIRNIERKTVEWLQAYDWPGNIRELQNVVERAVILCDGETFAIDEMWLQPEPRGASRPQVPHAATLLNKEREIIEAALEESHGRISGPSGAAGKLGIPRTTLESKIRTLRIDKHQFKYARA